MRNARLSYLWLTFLCLALAAAACDATRSSNESQSDEASNTKQTTEAGNSKNGQSNPPENTRTSKETDMALISAARNGDEQAVKQLLEQGADVEARTETGATALIAAAYRNHLEVAEMLIEAGADVNAKDQTQQSAYLISTAEVGDDPRLLKLTLRNGANVQSLDSYNGTGLIRAADRGYVDVVRELLKTDTNVDHVNNLGWTALLEAIILGDCDQRHTEVVRLLVEAGADVNLADGNGVTPLQHAREPGCEEIFDILQNAGAV